MTLKIRSAESGDAAALAAIGAQTFIESFGHLYAERDLNAFLATSHSEARYNAILADPRSAVWVVETEESTVVGYAVAGPCGLPVPSMPDNAGELARLYLLRSAQGGGVGGRLLGDVLTWLRDNFDHIYLSVYAENHGAQRLYRRTGFQKIHEYKFMVGNHADPEWIMKLQEST